MKLPVIEPLKKLIPTIKPIGKLTVSLMSNFTSFLFELFCNPTIKIKNKEQLNVNIKNNFFIRNDILFN